MAQQPPDTGCLVTWYLYLVVVTIFVGGVQSNDVTTTCRSNDVELQSRDCMSEFYSQLDALTNHQFFTGVDVEIIRSVCSWFQTSVMCLRALRDQCPRAMSDEFVDSLVEPHLSLHELCIHPEFYEQYAMRQTCFHRVRTQSENCWTHFRSTTADLAVEISSSSSSTVVARSTDPRRQAALHQYCSRLRSLQTCVKAAVHKACKKLAAGLVDVLVRASVELSPHCSAADDVTSRHAPTSTPGVDTRPGGKRGGGDGVSSSASAAVPRWCLVVAASLVVYLAAADIGRYGNRLSLTLS